MQVNVNEAKLQLFRLLELVKEGKTVAELIPACQKEFPFGIACAEPLVAPGDDWWQPMSDDEAENWAKGR